MSIHYINTGFENASPLDWHVDDAGVIHIQLIYDHERESPNRAVLHWHFQLQGDPGQTCRLLLSPFDNIWNGRHGSPINELTGSLVSPDGRTWSHVKGKKTADNCLALQVTLPESGRLYIARIEPYRVSDSDRLVERVTQHPRGQSAIIGRSLQGRPLQMLTVGDETAPWRLLIRARAHPWEPGGNWLLEGMIHRLLEVSSSFCLYAMPMANPDGVARGGHRFNLQGKDLNRNWDAPADPDLAPENAALENWLSERREAGTLPHLALDMHNDNSGKLLVSLPAQNAEAFDARMDRLAECLLAQSWFTEGRSAGGHYNPGSFGVGLLERFGVDGAVWELSAPWAEGLGRPPLGSDWVELGRQACDAFEDYFKQL